MEDGFDEDIEFGDEISDEGEGDPVDNVSIDCFTLILYISCFGNAALRWHIKVEIVILVHNNLR